MMQLNAYSALHGMKIVRDENIIRQFFLTESTVFRLYYKILK